MNFFCQYLSFLCCLNLRFFSLHFIQISFLCHFFKLLYQILFVSLLCSQLTSFLFKFLLRSSQLIDCFFQFCFILFLITLEEGIFLLETGDFKTPPDS